MSEPLVPVITRAGLNACVDAQGDGLQAHLQYIAVGRGLASIGGGGTTYASYVPSNTQTALKSQVIQVPLISGAKLDNAGFRVLARVPKTSTPAEYPIREVGFYLSDGTLFAVWSDPAVGVLAAKTALADIDLAFELYLQQIPTGSLTLTVEQPDIPDTATVLCELLAVGGNTFAKNLARERRAVARGLY